MTDVLLYLLFFIGAFFCGLNFHLSFLRVPLLMRRGVPLEEIPHVSGAPLIGSLFVLVGLGAAHQVPGFLPVGLILILIDTGGPHWFVGSLIYAAIRSHREEH
jgi:hypothetical protein